MTNYTWFIMFPTWVARGQIDASQSFTKQLSSSTDLIVTTTVTTGSRWVPRPRWYYWTSLPCHQPTTLPETRIIPEEKSWNKHSSSLNPEKKPRMWCFIMFLLSGNQDMRAQSDEMHVFCRTKPLNMAKIVNMRSDPLNRSPVDNPTGGCGQFLS